MTKENVCEFNTLRIANVDHQDHLMMMMTTMTLQSDD